MDSAKGFEDGEAGIVDKLASQRGKEGVVTEDLLAFLELLLRLLEVDVDEKAFDKLGDRVPIVVRLLLDDREQVLDLGLSSLADDYGRCQISQYVRTIYLNSLQISN